MSYKHIFFDLDATLWDFDANATEMLLEIVDMFELRKKGIADEDFIAYYKKINNELWQNYSRGSITREMLRSQRFYLTLLKFNLDDYEFSLKLEEVYLKNISKKTNLLPYTHEVLGYLREKYSLHIITNGFEEVQYIKLNQCQLMSYFKTIMTSEKAGCKKPNKIIFESSLQQANAIFKESMMIGDHLEADILGAKSAGMAQVFFNPARLVHSENPTYEISCLSELRKIL